MAAVKDLTGLTDEQIDEAIRWFSRQPRKIQLRCMKPEVMAETVKLAIQTRESIETGSSKNYEADPKQNWHMLGRAEDVRAEKLRSGRRRSPKASALWQRRALIKRLMKKHDNFSLVADYLSRYEQVSVTSSYLRRVWINWQDKGLV